MKNSMIVKAVFVAGLTSFVLGISLTASPPAEAAQCPAPLSDCQGTCYNPGSQTCYFGTVCNAGQGYCQGARACYQIGSQTCCPTAVVAAGAQCPASQSVPPRAAPTSPAPVNRGGGSEPPRPVGGAPVCTTKLPCPTPAQVNVIRTPTLPAGFTSGVGSTTHPTARQNIATTDGTNVVGSNLLQCGYVEALNGGTNFMIMRDASKDSLACSVYPDMTYDGFCCH